ncbi:MAG: MarR family winged helix-turn-helix transcriptional regulator [Pigmentiphaga sp.]|uniref:MarR family winged helix-turn-helix transcriptional regulator n=1 Tax=Pigmentiphaga sp. TaxID=1977564 RepID=UPI003B55625D
MSSSSHSVHGSIPREPEETDGDSQEMLNSIVTMLGRRLTVYTSLYQTALAERLGLGMVDVKALELVIEFEPITTGQLACLAGISSGGTTAVIDRLEATGFVVRDKHPLDRRIVVIRPVREKCAEIERHMRAVAEDVAHIGARYERDQLSAVHGFLAQCVHALKTEALGMLGEGGNAPNLEGRRHPGDDKRRN